MEKHTLIVYSSLSPIKGESVIELRIRYRSWSAQLVHSIAWTNGRHNRSRACHMRSRLSTTLPRRISST